MKYLISEIKKYGFFHGINNAIYLYGLKHAKTIKKQEKVIDAYEKNQKEINDFYARMGRII